MRWCSCKVSKREENFWNLCGDHSGFIEMENQSGDFDWCRAMDSLYFDAVFVPNLALNVWYPQFECFAHIVPDDSELV
jgi:hypothetical protein